MTLNRIAIEYYLPVVAEQDLYGTTAPASLSSGVVFKKNVGASPFLQSPEITTGSITARLLAFEQKRFHYLVGVPEVPSGAIEFVYLRPGGLDEYLRPDAISRIGRPL